MIQPRKFLLGGVALLALTGIAAAADVPMRAPQAVYTKAAPAWSWEGQYIGIHGGYFWGDNNVNGIFALEPRGGYGGFQFGYLHHLSRNWVIGYEVDISFGDINGAVGPLNNSIDYFGTARTRLGYAQGQWLFYATAGLAWAQSDLAAAGLTFDRPQVGYVVGAGIEYAFARNWSAKFEYLYMDLGTTNTNLVVVSTDTTASTVRLGLNYRFANWNPSAPSDFPVKAPVRTAGWTGPYIGVHGAYGFGDHDTLANGVVVSSLEPAGGLFGIQSGYNWQISRNWVFGVEADSSWGSLKDTIGTSTVDIDAKGTVRARYGYTNGNSLIYATGGLAWIHAEQNIAAGGVVRDQFYLGWTVGAGVEYALNARWSAKLEYAYSSYELSENPAVPLREEFNLHTIKFGLNYRAGIFDLIGMRW